MCRKVNIKFGVLVTSEKREKKWMREKYPGCCNVLILKQGAGYTDVYSLIS